MSQTSVQRQSIVSTIISFAGFGFGALNLLVLQKMVLTPEEWGLTRVVTEATVMLATLAMFGSTAVAGKFTPFYRHYLPKEKNDLPFVTTVVFISGLLFTLGLLGVFKPWIISFFGRKSALFAPFYFTLPIFVVCQSMFVYMETYAWFAGKVILANFLKELLFRLLTTALLLLMAFKLVAFEGFMDLFAFVYLPAAIILWLKVYQAGNFNIHFQISHVTRRLKGKMISLGAFVFITSFSTIAFTVCDTLFLAGGHSLAIAGIFSIAQYFSQVLEVPMRSINASSVPIVSEYWRAKNMVGLASIYKKSCINLLVIGMGLGGFILVNVSNIERYFGPEFAPVVIPLALLIVSRWINLGTGLNAVIIQLSSFWRFDFASTLIYTFIGIPLNYFMIKSYGMMGAAVANIIAMLTYNTVRFVFIWKKFGLQPFGYKNLGVLLGGCVVIAIVYTIPALPNLYIDGIIRSLIFAAAFGLFVIKGNFSEEINQLWTKWAAKLLRKQ